MEKKKINFSAHLDIETENDPFSKMAADCNVDRTTYFRKMLEVEFKKKTVYKMLKI